MKNPFKNKPFRIWSIVSGSVLLLGTMANVTCLGFIPGVMDNLFGGETGANRSDKNYFTTNEGVTDKETARKQSEQVNLKICEEGFTLLKNDGNMLPIKTSVSDTSIQKKVKVSVFGKNTTNLVLNGSGSGGGEAKNSKSIYDSLESAGYEVNPKLKSFYEDDSLSGKGRPASLAIEAGIANGFATGETPVSSYDATLKNSFSEYGDFALVMLSRTAGEGQDAPQSMVSTSGAASENDHYLELDQNEMDMLEMVCENFSKVVLVINSSNPMELGFLDDVGALGDTTMNDFDYASHIQSALWIGGPGSNGIMALGEILNGSVNPSGRLPDTYVRDFTKDPTYPNFSASKDRSDSYVRDGKKENAWFADYEEGIYVGYRYYETRGQIEGETWYKEHVVYPFGHGLSYTTFTDKIENKSAIDGIKMKKDGTYEVSVSISNDGNYDGKESLELYVETPYQKGGIEKASKVLIDFAKSDVIAKGKKQTVSFSFTPYDFASYDFNDKNQNGFSGYELEKGTYTFYVSKDAHTSIDAFAMVLDEDVRFEEDSMTGNKVVNRFDDVDDELSSTLSREDFDATFPKSRTEKEMEITKEGLDDIKSKKTNNPLTKDSKEVKEADLAYATKKDKNVMQLTDLIQADYDDERWDSFLQGVTVSTMEDMLNQSAFGSASATYIGKPKTIETDGPSGFVNFMGSGEVFDTSTNATQPVMAATRNKELLEEYGSAIGDEGIIGNTNDNTPYSGWYAPGMNIHRSPFGGRTYEYYSEDPLLNGILGSCVIEGAGKKGVTAYMKHFVANECETHRNEMCTWLDEQTLREIYLKPFEIAVKRSSYTRGVMSSFNRLGHTWTGGDYRLLTEVLRNEWGFKGAVICDFADLSFMDLKQMQYAGGDIYLNNQKVSSYVDKKNDLDIYVLKKCFKNYMYGIVNSNAMNGLGNGIAYKTSMAKWKVSFLVSDIVLGSLIILSGSVIVFLMIRKEKMSD